VNDAKKNVSLELKIHNVMCLLRAENIAKSFGEHKVLQNISLSFEPAQVVCLLGASGAGKSTLLNILGTLDTPTSGEVFYKKTPLSAMKGKELAKFRNENIGFVYQFHHLLSEFTVLENILLPAQIGGKDLKNAKTYALSLLDRLGILAYQDRFPATLSGGEQQRVAIARALINKPLLVLADEPSGNLDSENALRLHELFSELSKEMAQTFIVVTHNKSLANLADRQITLKDGQIDSL
jgi:lipoprotein-releasing system ATP-binding protein